MSTLAPDTVIAAHAEIFEEVFGEHEAGVYNAAYRLTGDAHDAADITQEAFLRVYTRLPALMERDVNLPAYLHRTARNLVYDRSSRRAREVASDEVETLVEAEGDAGLSPAAAALLDARSREVRAANARLPERHRLALALREVEGFGYADIGRALDITEGAVAQLLARARTALRRELRLEQVDPESMTPECRRRLPAIAALIDGQLDHDRAVELRAHLSECATCRASKEAFEDTGQRYRAWLPLGAIGLTGAAAEAATRRGLPVLALTDAVPRSERRAHRAALVGIAALGLLVIAGVPALVVGQDREPPAAEPPPQVVVAAPEPDAEPSSPVVEIPVGPDMPPAPPEPMPSPDPSSAAPAPTPSSPEVAPGDPEPAPSPRPDATPSGGAPSEPPEPAAPAPAPATTVPATPEERPPDPGNPAPAPSAPEAPTKDPKDPPPIIFVPGPTFTLPPGVTFPTPPTINIPPPKPGPSPVPGVAPSSP